MEKSLKTGPVQNHIMKLCGNFLYKVLNPAPTTIKQNHPRGTHRKIYLKKWLPMTACQRGKEKMEREKKKPRFNRILWQTHGPCDNPQHTLYKGTGKLNAIWFILGKSWTQYIQCGFLGLWVLERVPVCLASLLTGCGERDLSGHSRPPLGEPPASWTLLMWFTPRPST